MKKFLISAALALGVFTSQTSYADTTTQSVNTLGAEYKYDARTVMGPWHVFDATSYLLSVIKSDPLKKHIKIPATWYQNMSLYSINNFTGTFNLMTTNNGTGPNYLTHIDLSSVNFEIKGLTAVPGNYTGTFSISTDVTPDCADFYNTKISLTGSSNEVTKILVDDVYNYYKYFLKDLIVQTSLKGYCIH